MSEEMGGERPLPTEAGPSGRESRPGRSHPQTSLSLGVRIALLVLGWVVVLVGVAGLLLPGLQGVVTMVAGAAILSVASDRVHRWMEMLLERWPKVRQALNRFRQRVHERLARK